MLRLNCNLVSNSTTDHSQLFGFLLSNRRRFNTTNVISLQRRRCRRGGRSRCSRLVSEFKVESATTPSESEELKVRRFSPLLESEFLSSDNVPSTGEWKAVPDIWKFSADRYGDRIALVDPYHDPPSEMTYKQLEEEILAFCEGLRVIGVNPDEKLALFADNSCRWLVADQGIMATGAIDVVRGTTSSVQELLQIYIHSESVALVVDNPDILNKISEPFMSRAVIRYAILLWGEKSSISNDVSQSIPIFNYKEILDLGRDSRRGSLNAGKEGRSHIYEAIKTDDIATLMYTSGTTGNPKGVMLTHRNLMHQIKNLWNIVPVVPGDRFLSMLPPWHAYERSCEYFTFTHGAQQVYTTIRNFKDDLKTYQPDYLISVPVVYETLYSAIQKQISNSSYIRKLIALTLIKTSLLYMDYKRVYEGNVLCRHGKQGSILLSMLDYLWARTIAALLWPLHMLAANLVYRKIRLAIGITKAGISGGGSLPSHVDNFFEAIGIKLQNGYGLTESSPVVAARRPNCNVLGTIGHPLQHTEFKVTDLETGELLAPGSKGVVKVKGPQIMKGYYKNPSATQEAVDEEGWLNTGDMGWIAPNHSRGRSRHCGGMIVLEGRAKDTIVLLTGENVEPSMLEEAALQSKLIQQIVVVGQDQRRLGALIYPNKEEILAVAKELSIIDEDASEISKEKVTNLLLEELRTWTSEFQFQVGPISILEEPFTIESGLMTPTMKIRRDEVMTKYGEQIANLYK